MTADLGNYEGTHREEQAPSELIGSAFEHSCTSPVVDNSHKCCHIRKEALLTFLYFEKVPKATSTYLHVQLYLI